MHGRGRGRGGRGGGPFSHGGGPEEDARGRDKALRSIFVANVGFETTEDQLGKVLCEVGPIVNLKLIYDPGTGKPRGFGFCEYEDVETAMSAVRNLAGREVAGRPLRIDSAANAPSAGGSGMGGPGMNAEGSRGPGAGPGQGPKPVEPPVHGAPVAPENAPEHITKAVASLPPEQMYELMTQMKWFIQQNPQEARQLLLHNPQLAYALLQAQVVMKIVDLETAQGLLHRTSRGPSLTTPAVVKKEPPPPAPPAGHHGPPPPGLGMGGEPEGFQPLWDQFQGPPQGGREGRGGQPVPPPPGEYNRMRPGGPPGFDRGPPPGHRGSPHRDTRPSLPPPPPPPSRDQQGQTQPPDQEKAALIMQVLSLTDEQIQMLPTDQRSSILKLKDQIARSR